jgi:tetratricopeptide (TPR) repeat protein
LIACTRPTKVTGQPWQEDFTERAILFYLFHWPTARNRSFDQTDVWPFPLAWVCFQLGMLWGELVPLPDPNLAGHWYLRAIAYLPGYVRTRVRLAEIYASQGQTGDAEVLLLPALSSRDPEVRWRLADVLIAQERFEEAEIQFDAARPGFDELLRRQLLAFADQAAVFYTGSGNDCRRALELARECSESSDTPCRQAGASDRGACRCDRRELGSHRGPPEPRCSIARIALAFASVDERRIDDWTLEERVDRFRDLVDDAAYATIATRVRCSAPFRSGCASLRCKRMPSDRRP